MSNRNAASGPPSAVAPMISIASFHVSPYFVSSASILDLAALLSFALSEPISANSLRSVSRSLVFVSSFMLLHRPYAIRYGLLIPSCAGLLASQRATLLRSKGRWRDASLSCRRGPLPPCGSRPRTTARFCHQALPKPPCAGCRGGC